MGNIRLRTLPDYFTKWGVPHGFLDPGWLNVSRSSGGYDAILGIILHHSAESVGSSLASQLRWGTVTSPNRPVGAGTYERLTGKPWLWAGGATNTAGKGGPLLGSRGVILKDSANRTTINLEAQNNGVGEPWSDEMCDMIVLACCAMLDWANNETPGAPLGAGDVWAHFEWAPSRKIDPFGPCKFNGYSSRKWNMDQFRGAVFARQLLGPSGQIAPPPVTTPTAPIVTRFVIQAGMTLTHAARALGYSVSELAQYNKIANANLVRVGQVIEAPARATPAPTPARPTRPAPSCYIKRVEGEGRDKVVTVGWSALDGAERYHVACWNQDTGVSRFDAIGDWLEYGFPVGQFGLLYVDVAGYFGPVEGDGPATRVHVQ